MAKNLLTPEQYAEALEQGVKAQLGPNLTDEIDVSRLTDRVNQVLQIKTMMSPEILQEEVRELAESIMQGPEPDKPAWLTMVELAQDTMKEGSAIDYDVLPDGEARRGKRGPGSY